MYNLHYFTDETSMLEIHFLSSISEERLIQSLLVLALQTPLFSDHRLSDLNVILPFRPSVKLSYFPPPTFPNYSDDHNISVRQICSTPLYEHP